MATAKWATPSTETTSLVGAELDSLADDTESSAFTHDNSTNLDLYARVRVELGSITPGTGGSITLRVLDNSADAGAGGERYSQDLASGTGAKTVVFNRVSLHPKNMKFSVINNAGVSLAASANDVYLQAYNEASS